MKRFILFVFIVISTLTWSYGQEKVELVIDEDPMESPYKNYGGYILNLEDEYLQAPKWELPKFELMPQFKQPANSAAFQLDGPTYMQLGAENRYLNRYYTPFGRGFYHAVDAPINAATFRLKNGMNLTTFGDYDADGNKRRIPSAYPWEKNNFRGGFELKSNNGKFGIRVEVEQRKGNPYGPQW